MSTFIERLEVEVQELELKISKLEDFLTTETFMELAQVDKILLKDQLETMNKYSRILNARLMRLKQ